ncbi:MAG TPA: toll/interleukin-1 receptor domain-containing protein [Sphingomicrobium sp.]|nr:toll/interleukin-1 receptor domain-containing protein [Sphingomicrobium sp.]
MSDEETLSQSYFLSYSRADQDFALRFATDLRARDVPIWIDQLDIRPSEHWDRAIERAVRDCRGLIVILSPSSVESDNVADEISYAIDRAKPVLPVMIERCQMPLRITRMQMIDATGDYDRALNLCLEAIAATSGSKSPPKIAPALPPRGISDAAIIDKARTELTDILGPIAAIIVDKAAASSTCLDDFHAELAKRIPSKEDRERFLGSKTRSGGSETAKESPAPAPKGGTSTLSKEAIDRLAQTLTSFIGPIAPIVVKRESSSAGSLDELAQRLASRINNSDERADFLRRVKAS